MKKVINTSGIQIEVDASVTTKMIDGVHYLLTPEEEAQEVIKSVEWQAGEVKRKALQEMERLEAEITPRRYREKILGIGNGWLARQDALIAAERAKL